MCFLLAAAAGPFSGAPATTTSLRAYDRYANVLFSFRVCLCLLFRHCSTNAVVCELMQCRHWRHDREKCPAGLHTNRSNSNSSIKGCVEVVTPFMDRQQQYSNDDSRKRGRYVADSSVQGSNMNMILISYSSIRSSTSSVITTNVTIFGFWRSIPSRHRHVRYVPCSLPFAPPPPPPLSPFSSSSSLLGVGILIVLFVTPS